MNLENQVVSLEVAKKLKEVGVKQESLFSWWNWYDRRPYPQPEGYGKDFTLEQAWEQTKWECTMSNCNEISDMRTRTWKGMYSHTLVQYSAFTVAELGEMLPEVLKSTQLETWRFCNKWTCGNQNLSQTADTEADARAKMLCYILENKLIPLDA